MCFIISIVLLILSYNFYMADSIVLALGSLLGSIFFIILMVKNILHVKNLRKNQKGKDK